MMKTRLLVKTLYGMTIILTSAIQYNGDASFVYVIENGTALMRNVKAGRADGNMTAVEGINLGDVVANSSFENLPANSRVVLAKVSRPATTNGIKAAP
jgi:multidrug efflux system membrane fusion protein